jgi:phospholipid/cholesterol/gamma-HCH transport system substrate-binding protein
MRVSATTLSRGRSATVVIFVLVSLAIFVELYVKFGGAIPFVTGKGYKISADFPNIQNLATDGDVEMAGVPIGKVSAITRHGTKVEVTMILSKSEPLHQGATVQIRPKTLLNETYVQITDGSGATLASKTLLPTGSVEQETTLNDVLNSFGAPTRKATGQLLLNLQSATANQGTNLNQVVAGLAQAGRQGESVLDILANQNADLQQLVKQSASLVGTLDEGQGQIGDLASAAQRVSQASSNVAGSLAETVQDLPPLITTVQGDASSVISLSDALAPIAANLKTAAPDLNADLVELAPDTTGLRADLPALTTTLNEAPATLTPLPTTSTNLNNLLPSAAKGLANLNPMVAYLAPYNADLAGFISNFGAAVGHVSPGNPDFAASQELVNGDSLQDLGVAATNAGPAPRSNNNSSQAPAPLGTSYAYPHIQEEPY